MKNKMFFLVFIILLIGILIGLFLGNKVLNKRNEVSYRNEIKGQNNILSQKNVLENNKVNTGVYSSSGSVTNVTGFNVKNYLDKKEKEWKQLWAMSDQQLYDLLKNDIKFEQKYKIDDLCNYLFYGKDDYKLKKCLGMSYNFVRRLMYILAYRLFIAGKVDKNGAILSKNLGNKQKILSLLENFDKTSKCIYRFLTYGKYFLCDDWNDTIEQYKSTLIFFWFLVGNNISSLPMQLKSFYNEIKKEINTPTFLLGVDRMALFSFLLPNCGKNFNCVKENYFKNIDSFLEVLNNIIGK